MSLSIPPLVQSSNPILREVMPQFNFEKPEMDPKTLSDTLAEAMTKYGGLGLSACQIGIRARAFCLKVEPIITLFNPIIVDAGEEEQELDEGCLSLPGLMLKIKRPRIIKIRYKLYSGASKTLKLSGLTSSVVQHENDHLDGILFYDHVSKLKLDAAKKKAAKNGYPNIFTPTPSYKGII